MYSYKIKMTKKEVLLTSSKQSFLEELTNYQTILTPFSIHFNQDLPLQKHIHMLANDSSAVVQGFHKINFEELQKELQIYNQLYGTDFTRQDYATLINNSASQNKTIIHTGPNTNDYSSKNGRFALYKESERRHIHAINHAQLIELYLKQINNDTLIYAPKEVQTILNVQDL